MHINICFLTPAKLRSGDYIFKYSLLSPGEAQKRGLFIQIFAFSPWWNSKAGLIHSNICFLAPAQFKCGVYTSRYSFLCPRIAKTLELYRQAYLNPHKTNHAQRNPTKHCRLTLRVILFLSNELSIQKSEYHNLSTSTPTTAQIFDANQILLYQINRYRICK